MASAIATLLKKLGSEQGVVIDDEDLAGIGLTDDGLETGGEPPPPPSPPASGDDVLAQTIPGSAAGAIELFLGDDALSTTKVSAKTSDGLMWYPIIREGQWAVRPGPNGTKRRVPLKVVPGHSANQRREIGLQDLLDAHNEQAVQHVTVPLSHANSLVENQGFIDKMKIVEATVKNKVTKGVDKVKVLMGGYRITEPDTRGKLERGTYANRSAGLLYDYVDTERGKKWSAVIEHVALTNKPWITGMASFGRPLAGLGENKLEVVRLSLSDEGLSDEDYALALSSEAELDDSETDFLADPGVVWDHEDSPNWIAEQVNNILLKARADKMASMQRQANTTLYVDDAVPRYRCVEADSGRALISDGWGDNSNFFVAGVTVASGEVTLDDSSKWQAAKKVFIADQRDKPDPANIGLDAQAPSESKPEPEKKSRRERAVEARKARARGTSSSETHSSNPSGPPRGGGNMAGENGSNTVELSEVARREIEALKADNEALKKSNELLAEQFKGMSSTVKATEADKYIAELQAANFDEAHGFGGVLVVVRELMLADDGEPAVVGDQFSDTTHPKGELSLSDSIRRIFGAFKRAEDGKLALSGEGITEPSNSPPPVVTENSAGGVTITGAGGGATVKVDENLNEDGKPPKDATKEELSAEQKVDALVEAGGDLGALLAPSRKTNGKGGES